MFFLLPRAGREIASEYLDHQRVGAEPAGQHCEPIPPDPRAVPAGEAHDHIRVVARTQATQIEQDPANRQLVFDTRRRSRGELSVKDDGPIVEATFVTTMRPCSDCLIIRRIQYGEEFLPLTTKPTA